MKSAAVHMSFIHCIDQPSELALPELFKFGHRHLILLYHFILIIWTAQGAIRILAGPMLPIVYSYLREGTVGNCMPKLGYSRLSLRTIYTKITNLALVSCRGQLRQGAISIFAYMITAVALEIREEIKQVLTRKGNPLFLLALPLPVTGIIKMNPS